MNLSMCADSSTDNKKYEEKRRRKNPCDTFHLSPVTCQLLPTPTAIDPPPANSPKMHRRLVHQDINQKISLLKRMVKNIKKRISYKKNKKSKKNKYAFGLEVSSSGCQQREHHMHTRTSQLID